MPCACYSRHVLNWFTNLRFSTHNECLSPSESALGDCVEELLTSVAPASPQGTAVLACGARLYNVLS